ncbi:acetylaminoadipate kinase [Candidatus Acidianus copahuensis]|uniref:[LysW]-aminoadipate/[LysW]-glutamate kinase n=1 Tax=Candidatus Acidianus copahuensis TaxID=1160895 RepID=A0A031LNQ2_9CREN|nr:[LysW]-aminoadipate/[LysW]-glutamate kinase [Candidatus Acidianus copahuensis]EZQ04754.1 acetylaminoadipate kinase [Candidatus Acidianus copahuensis]
MIVIKSGGRVIKNSFDKLINSLSNYNESAVFVHGGGDIVTDYSKRMGIEPTFVVSPEGIRSRYTTREELDIYVMAMNLINKNIVSSISSKGRNVVGITGADGPSIYAERKKRIMIIDERGKKRIIEGGYTGKIIKVNNEFLLGLISLVNYVVMAPIAIDVNEGVLLNVDGDQMALAVAKTLRADALVILTDVEGVLVDGKVINKLSVNEAKDLAKKIGPGMNRKILMAASAVEEGVKRVIISSGLKDNSVLEALSGKGTVIE